MTQNNESIQTRATSRPQHSHSLRKGGSGREYKKRGKQLKWYSREAASLFKTPLSINKEGKLFKWRANREDLAGNEKQKKFLFRAKADDEH